jgi:PPOX class probable F420-dependent enzyme
VNLPADRSRHLLASARVARLATVDERGQPHLVPVTFATAGDTVVIPVDHKPKRTTDLRRLRNIRGNPRVSVLADHYDDDWQRLWWARADGTARILEGGEERAEALHRLAQRYPQYREHPPDGPVIAVDVARWSGWAYAGTAPASAAPGTPGVRFWRRKAPVRPPPGR